jgi:hypothetical protein
VANWRHTLEKVLSGTADANLRFQDLTRLLERLGFDGRIDGSHHVYWRDDLESIVNLQSKKGKAKPYQVRQVRNLILDHALDLELEDDNEESDESFI